MLAAQQVGASSFVSVAGLARRASDVIRDQLRPGLSPSLWAESERLLAALEAGDMAGPVPSEFSSCTARAFNRIS